MDVESLPRLQSHHKYLHHCFQIFRYKGRSLYDGQNIKFCTFFLQIKQETVKMFRKSCREGIAAEIIVCRPKQHSLPKAIKNLQVINDPSRCQRKRTHRHLLSCKEKFNVLNNDDNLVEPTTHVIPQAGHNTTTSSSPNQVTRAGKVI